MNTPTAPMLDPSYPPEFPPPWACDWGEDSHGLWIAFRYQGVRQQLRWMVPGEFMMGSPDGEPERENDENQHQVILTQGFWLADTACTQALWQVVMGDNPSEFTNNAENPIEHVSWEDVQIFLEKLNAIFPGDPFRLPTEAEWEYACRAGTQTPFWFGEQITTDQVNYDGSHPYADGEEGEYRRETAPVKALPCNGWGLYQMHGNVWEWCQDWYGDYAQGTVIDPTRFDRGDSRVLRGGSWADYGWDLRSAFRFRFSPDDRDHDFGFRLARGAVPAQQGQAEDVESSDGQT